MQSTAKHALKYMCRKCNTIIFPLLTNDIIVLNSLIITEEEIYKTRKLNLKP